MPCEPQSLLRCTNDITTLRFPQGTDQCVQLTVKDLNGNPLDLNTLVGRCAGDGSSSSSPDSDVLKVFLLMRESWTTMTTLIDKEGDIIDAASGLVRFSLHGDDDLLYAGMFTAAVIVKRENERLHVMQLFLGIDPSPDATMAELSPALTVSWIRLMMRDTCPEANYLLDELEFSDTEIMFALRHPIDEWNELPPPVSSNMTPKTFPYRNHHAKAAIAELLMLAARWYARNHLSYQAAGVSVQDRDKAQVYMAMAERLRAEWLSFVRNKKVELNVSGGMLTLTSSYSAINAFYGFR